MSHLPHAAPLLATIHLFSVSLSLFSHCFVCFFRFHVWVKLHDIWLWLISLSIIPTRYIQVTTNGKISFLFKWLSDIPWCMSVWGYMCVSVCVYVCVCVCVCVYIYHILKNKCMILHIFLEVMMHYDEMKSLSIWFAECIQWGKPQEDPYWPHNMSNN